MMKTVILYLASAIGLMRMFQKAGYFDQKTGICADFE